MPLPRPTPSPRLRPRTSSLGRASALVRVDAALAGATRQLRESGSSSPRLDAELLLGFVLGVERTYVLAHAERELLAAELAAFEKLLVRRSRAEPMAYLLGEREFYGHLFT